VTAQLEEVVVQPYALDTQDIPPDRRDLLLDDALRGLILSCAPLADSLLASGDQSKVQAVIQQPHTLHPFTA